MEGSKDLEEFRKAWRRELSSGKPPKDKDSSEKHSSFGVEESKAQPNTYQSFLLAEDLLKQNDSEIHEKFSANVQLRRKRSSCPSLNELDSQGEDTESSEAKVARREEISAESKERFLDIFLADLVRLCRFVVQHPLHTNICLQTLRGKGVFRKWARNASDHLYMTLS